MSAGYYKIHLAKDGQTYFTLHAANGKVIATSEMYRKERSAMKGIRSVQTNASFDDVRYAKGHPLYVK